jgi:L-ascorbate metabolism protein UlaG (beta-lactamase superfamily)
MQIHFIRNATLIVHAGTERILVDPMLGPQGSLPPYAFIRHRPRRNPTVSLPPDVKPVLETITAGLITHCRRGHFDHLDRAGWRLLARRGVPVYCNPLDRAYLQRRGLAAVPLGPNRRHTFLGGGIIPFETRHGYGLVGKLMGPGLGYLIELPGEPSLYISGDTVLTPVVRRVLVERRPDVAVLNAGGASLDLGRPILMPLEEKLEFVRLAPGTVIAVHLEALNHCPVTRAQFREAVAGAGLAGRVRVPADGELLTV